MLIKLIRNKPSGKAIFGRLLVDCENVSGFQSFKLQMDTLEHTDYAIPSSFYRLRITHSPRFKELLPILDGVLGRSGIRIHAGNTIEHTTGCILVGERLEAKGERLLSSRKALNQLREYLLNYQKEYPKDEIYIEVCDPDTYPLYDTPCPCELQQHIIDANRAAERYNNLNSNDKHD